MRVGKKNFKLKKQGLKLGRQKDNQTGEAIQQSNSD